MPDFHNRELMLEDIFEIQKQSALEKTEPKPEERIINFSKLSGGLGLIEAGMKLFEYTDSNEQPTG